MLAGGDPEKAKAIAAMRDPRSSYAKALAGSIARQISPRTPADITRLESRDVQRTGQAAGLAEKKTSAAHTLMSMLGLAPPVFAAQTAYDVGKQLGSKQYGGAALTAAMAVPMMLAPEARAGETVAARGASELEDVFARAERMHATPPASKAALGGQAMQMESGGLPKQTLELEHYGAGATKDVIDPAFQGTGVKGSERQIQAAWPEEYVPRSYFYKAGVQPEHQLAGAPKTKVSVTGSFADEATQQKFVEGHPPLRRCPSVEQVPEADRPGRF